MSQMQTKIANEGERHAFRLGDGHIVSCAIMKVGPALARQWLEREHPANRKTPSVTRRYAREMLNDGWRTSPQPVIFSEVGMVIDGGNRLRAIIESGATVTLTVWFDWPSEAFACFDRNAPRSLFQADSMVGLAHARKVYEMARSFVFVDENRTVIADAEIREKANALAAPWDSLKGLITTANIVKRSGGLRASSSVMFCIAWLSDPDSVVAFLQELIRAVKHEGVPTSPVRNFIRWYENTYASSGNNYDSSENVYAVASSLRQFVSKRESQFVHPTREAYKFWRDRHQVMEAFGEKG